MASDLGLHCLPVSHQKDASLIWVKLDHIIRQITECVECARIASFGLLGSTGFKVLQWNPSASLRCGPRARHIYPSLVLVQPRKTRPCLH